MLFRLLSYVSVVFILVMFVFISDCIDIYILNKKNKKQ
jgi:hypothetical protein